MAQGAPPVPDSQRATSSMGFCVADRPSRSSGLRRDVLQALERQRQVRAAPRADHRVDLVDDDGADGAQHPPAALRRQQQIQATPVSSPECAAAA